MSAPQVDIIKRLHDNADSLDRPHHSAAAAVMRDAANIIEQLRAEINASWGVAGTRVTGWDAK